MTTDAEWMVAQEADYNRGTFARMTARWRFPKPVEAISRDRQLEIALQVADKAREGDERTAS